MGQHDSAWLKSLMLHGALFVTVVVAALWNGWERDEPPMVLAIEAVVVDARALTQLPAPEPSPDPEPEPLPVPEPEPGPTVEEQRKAEQRKADDQRKAEERRKAEEQRKAEDRRKAEDKRKAEALRKSEELRIKRELAEQQDAEQRRAQAEQDLRRQLDAEVQQVAAARAAASQSAQWAAAIQARVQRAWIRPASAKAGLDCRVAVAQVPGGTVVRVEVKECNGDEAVRQSIEAAVYRASPLPPPPDPALFERNLELRFRPNE